MANILDLPNEILMIIFKYCLQTEKQLDFINIAKVCSKWKAILKSCWFWHKFDGSLSKHYLLYLSKNKLLQSTEEIVLSQSTKSYTPEEIKQILVASPRLKYISFENVREVKDNVFICLAKYGLNICEIKLGKDSQTLISCSMGPNAIEFINCHGNNLTILDMSYTKINALQQVLKAISGVCRNLRQLHLHEMEIFETVFPLKSFQIGCPKLEVLRLGSPIVYKTIKINADFPGFPNLEIFTHPGNQCWNFLDADLINILSNSPNLKLLDIRGCIKITANSILALPATHLENLHLGMTSLDYRMVDIFIKWGRSLRVLDFSKIKYDCIDKVLMKSTAGERLNGLEQLDLSFTNVTTEVVVKVIDNCKHLEVLNLTSCRSLKRGLKHEYRGKVEIEKLLNCLRY